MTKVLIVRSAPIQQLDASLTKIRSVFQNPSISILSHQHSVELLQKYHDIERIIPYPYKDSFDFKRKVSFDSVSQFDHAVVMVGKLSRSGFVTVLLFALALPVKKIWICNLIGQLKFISKPLVALITARNLFYKLFSSILCLSFCFLIFPFLALFLIRKPS